MFDCDVLLPTAARYTSTKYRRVSRWFDPYHLDWDDALELVAFVETVGDYAARFALQWDGPAVVEAYHLLRAHIGDRAEALIQHNLQLWSFHESLALWKALRDGNFPKNKRVPPLVADAIRGMRHAGMGLVELGAIWGVRESRIASICRARGRSRRDAAVYALQVAS